MPYSKKEKQKPIVELDKLIKDLELAVEIVELKGGIL